MSFTESTALAVLSTTFFPLLSVSMAPNAQSRVQVKTGASSKVWPSVCPYGLPFFLSATKSLRASSHVFGYWLAPASFNHDLR